MVQVLCLMNSAVTQRFQDVLNIRENHHAALSGRNTDFLGLSRLPYSERRNTEVLYMSDVVSPQGRVSISTLLR
eukprot:5749-Eustigmatos_ZCMA.PRE.1